MSYDLATCFFLAVCLICVVIFFVAVIYMRYRESFSRRKSSGSRYDSRNDDDYITPSISIAEGFCGLMEKRGLERFLIRDYCPAIPLYKGDFTDSDMTQKKLYHILYDILNFLELPDIIRLHIEYVNDSNTGKSQAGSYSRNTYYDRAITVKIHPFYGPKNILAIVCHEVTHYFMEYNKLNWNDTELNEQRTDVVANLIGFSKIMSDGYREVVTSETSLNTRTTTRHKIGYISVEDCKDIWRFLLRFRKNFRKKQEQQKQFDVLKQKVSEYIETAKTLAQQLEYVSVPDIKALTPEHVMKIQQVLAEKESRNIHAEILKHEETLRRVTDLEQIQKSHQEMSRLCGELVSWASIFQGK